MSLLVVSFLASLVATLILVRSMRVHGRMTADADLAGPQKFHAVPVPRIGGLAVFVAVVTGAAFAFATPRSEFILQVWLIVACSVPAFVGGLAEDLTKNVSPRRRLALTAVSAALGCWLLDAVLPRADIPGIDWLMRWFPFAVALTLLCVTGVANSINIIDGFNGLASMCVLLMLLAIGYVALQVGDMLVLTMAMIAAGAVLGFFIWNFPAGLVFLGDGGAYFLGFIVAELAVLLVARHDRISALCPLLICAYPIFETLFTIYRRKFIRGVPTGEPDGIHLHTLIHRRIVRNVIRGLGGGHERRQTTRNSMTSPYLWLLCLLSIIPAVLWWNNTPILSGFLLVFMVSYVFLYWSIVRFRVPRWLVLRSDSTRPGS